MSGNGCTTLTINKQKVNGSYRQAELQVRKESIGEINEKNCRPYL